MAPKAQNILIVEDDDVLKEIVKKGLENASHNVLTASTGEEMFGILASTPVDLILLDLGLPDGDALPHILNIREQTNAPLVILTARERIDDRLMALGLGADDYLTKPIDIRELVLRVNNILTRRTDSPASTAPAINRAPAQQDSRGRGRRRDDRTPQRRASDNARNRRASDRPQRSGLMIAGGILAGITVAGAGAFWLSISTPEEAAQMSVESAALEAGDDISDQPEMDPDAAKAPADEPDSDQPSAATGDAGAQDTPTSTSDGATSNGTSSTALTVAETVTVGERSGTPDTGTSVMVTATPTTNQPSDTTVDLDELSKAEVLGYAWAFNSQCGAVPQVDWWKYTTRAEIAEYVIRRHEGDWQPFIDDLVRRLAKMYDIAERDSAAVTPDGDRMEGEDLERYIEQSVARLQVVRCLAKEAELAAGN